MGETHIVDYSKTAPTQGLTDWLAQCQYTVTGLDTASVAGKWFLCGSMYTCHGNTIPDTYYDYDLDVKQQQKNKSLAYSYLPC